MKGPTPQFMSNKPGDETSQVNDNIDATFGEGDNIDETDKSIQYQISKDLEKYSPMRSKQDSSLSFAPQPVGANSTTNSYASQALKNML